jgi:NADPH2:quinone reductase
MRAVVINRVGGSEVLQLSKIEKPLPGPGEVLVKVHSAGVNPADWKCREGNLAQFLTYRFPFVLGFDLAGTVEAVGEGVEDFAADMKVFAQSDVGAGKWGSYAEYACVRQDSVVPMPVGLSFTEAAAVPTPALAAWAGLFDDGALQAGQKVLVHGGASAVGMFAIQFASVAGAEVIATCGADNLGYVQSLGCAQAIDYRAQNIRQAVQAWSPGGVDLVLDCVGCGSLQDALDMLSPGGMLVGILTLVEGDAGPDHAEAASRGLRTAVTYSKMPSGGNLGKIAALMANGKVQPPRIETMPLAQVAIAHDLLQSGRAKRKLVLQMAEGD